MDYIKSWYEYFRGNTTDRSRDSQAEELKNELLKLHDNPPPVIDNNPRRERMDIESPSDIMRIFFGDSGSNFNNSDMSSGMDSSWPFNSDMFHSANDFHKEFLNLVNELHKEFSSMQNFIFQDSPFQNSQDCLRCDRPQMGESLRDYYLTVPDLESIKSDNKCNKLGIINPDKDTGGIISSNGPHFHQTQQIVSVSVGPDGVLEITKITKDSNGKSEKTVTKVDLKDKM